MQRWSYVPLPSSGVRKSKIDFLSHGKESSCSLNPTTGHFGNGYIFLDFSKFVNENYVWGKIPMTVC
jgi:hypothetical protein